MKRALLTTLAVAGSLAVAIPAFAQQGGGMGPGGGPGTGQGFTRMCDNHEARLAGMLAFAEKKLKITDAQKAAWTKFADQARASGAPLQAACTGLKDKPQPANAIERLERMDTMMTARQQQMHQMVPAIKEMYGQLTPEQQKVADEMLNRGPGRGGMHGQRHGDHMMGGPRG
ncbi:Spy/CpxP family protein refolding chaperone [Azospirillum sp. TSO22-1]|uniref:Spy/CpxP family protein refolding chaperone n=1 Tax=Azospirillum sp. TSO22-1 TaxID=716789 RepID=UPI000D610178|nr:Spy/CpxP family protein refolding chaperone [Azospirillum sp. TSO22-1]PWC55181.1 hypothetical protein TSO221_06135 [Azospirillum sp. TSO22-1]